jgi:hypothetical protein
MVSVGSSAASAVRCSTTVIGSARSKTAKQRQIMEDKNGTTAPLVEGRKRGRTEKCWNILSFPVVSSLSNKFFKQRCIAAAVMPS